MIENRFDMIIDSNIIPRKIIYDNIIKNWYERGRDDLGEKIHIFTRDMDSTIEDIAYSVSKFKHNLDWYKTSHKRFSDHSYMELAYRNKRLMFVTQPEKYLYREQRGLRGMGVILDMDIKSMKDFINKYNNKLGWTIMYCNYPSKNNFGVMWIY